MMRLKLCPFILDFIMITTVTRSGPGAQGVRLAADRRHDRILWHLCAETWRVQQLWRGLSRAVGIRIVSQ